MIKTLYNMETNEKNPSSGLLAGPRDKKQKISESKHPKSISNTSPSLKEDNLLLFSGEGIRLSIVSKYRKKITISQDRVCTSWETDGKDVLSFFVELFSEKSLFSQSITFFIAFVL